MRKALKSEVHNWMLRLFVCGCCNIALLQIQSSTWHKNFVLDVPGILMETGIAAVAFVFAFPILIKGTIWFRFLALPFLIFPALMLLASFLFLNFIF